MVLMPYIKWQTEQDAGRAALASDRKDHDDADGGEDGREVVGLQEGHDDIVTSEAGQGEQPGRDGGADVGAHDNIDSLTQLHDAGVDEADDHDGGGGGGLDDGRDEGAEEDTAQRAAGQMLEQALQAQTGAALERLAEKVHAIEEQGKAAYKL